MAKKQIQNNLKEGDVFRWEYKEGDRSYHCKSTICICNSNGILFDNYWGYQPYRVEPKDVDLDFLGNLKDCEEIPREQAYKYNRDDYIDLQNPNNTEKNIYLKKGSVPVGQFIIDKLEQDLRDYESDIRFAKSRILEIKEEIKGIKPTNN